MPFNFEFIIITPLLMITLVIFVLRIFKKKKRSAKSIYKLIDDLEKKYIY